MIYAYRLYDKCKDLCKKVKTGDTKAMDIAAERLSLIIPKDSILVPVPGHLGVANYTLLIAWRMAREYGFRIENCLYGDVRDSLCDMKKDGRKTEPPVFYRRYFPRSKGNYVLVDNVYHTGMTYEAAKKALRKKCDIVVIGKV